MIGVGFAFRNLFMGGQAELRTTGSIELWRLLPFAGLIVSTTCAFAVPLVLRQTRR